MRLPPGSLRGRRRDAALVQARHLAYWIARRRYHYTYPEIGRIADRHHTTVLEAVHGLDARLHAPTMGAIDTIDEAAQKLARGKPFSIASQDRGD